MKSLLLVAVLSIVFLSSAAEAQTTGVACIKFVSGESSPPCTLPTSLMGAAWGSNTSVTVGGYYNVGDGGGGTFVNNTISGACPVTPDGGTEIQGGGTPVNCWGRQNVSGDLRQWGITHNSVFDADEHAISATDAEPTAANAMTILASKGITNVDFNQVNVYFASILQVPITTSIGCGATGGEQISGLNSHSQYGFLYRPGTIFLAHSTYIHFQNTQDASYIHNCLILPAWLRDTMQAGPCSLDGNGGITNFSYPPRALLSDLDAIRSNMIICGDVAVFMDSGSGGISHDVWAYGFDNPFFFYQADHNNMKDSAADGDICYYSALGGGNSRIQSSICDVTLTKNPLVFGATRSHPNCAQNTTHGNIVCNSEYWQIQSITFDPAVTNSYGRHVCQLQLVQGAAAGNWSSAPSVTTTDIPTMGYLRRNPPAGKPSTAFGDPINYPMWISNLNRTTGAVSCLGHGPFAVGNVSIVGTTATLDLLESEWGMGADIISATATWDACAQPPCAIRIAFGDVDAMEYDEIVTGTDIPNDPLNPTRIVSVVRNAKGKDAQDGYLAEIFVNVPLTIGHSTDVTINLDSNTNGTGLYAASGSCDDAQVGQCAFFHTGTRTFAGNAGNPSTGPLASSAPGAGLASSMLPESGTHYYGAGYIANGTAGLTLTDSFSFSHHFGYVIQDANSAVMTNRGGDANGELDDLGDEFYAVNGNSNLPIVQGGKGGQSGLGVVNNFYSLMDQATHQASISDPVPAKGWITVLNTGGTSLLLNDAGSPGTAGGHGTGHICPTTGCTSTVPAEYVTYEILNSTQVFITSRGDYFTSPIGYSTAGSAILISDNISRPNFCLLLASTSTPVTNPGQDSIENVGGCLQIVNVMDAQPLKNVFIGHNATVSSFSSSNFAGQIFLYEDSAAYNTMTGCGNALTSGAAWNCSAALAPVGISADTTLDLTAASIWTCDASAGNVNITVPPGTSFENRTLSIRKTDTSANTCAITMSSGDTLDGASSYLLNTVNAGIVFTNDNGTAWYSRIPPPKPLSHGQVYLSYNGTPPLLGAPPSLQLCPSNGSGLIINQTLVSIPIGCLFLANTSSTGSSVLNDIFAVNVPEAVSMITGTVGGPITVTTAATPFKANDQVWATCYGTIGVPGADVTTLATITSSTTFQLQGTSYSAGTSSPGGTCSLLGLIATTHTGHVPNPATGVEVKGTVGAPIVGDTLVGMAYVGASHALNDNLSQRDVASWFNRQPKKMFVPLASSAAVGTMPSGYHTPTTPVEGEFLALGNPVQSNITMTPGIQWNVQAGANLSSGSPAAGVAACFSTSSLAASTACPGTGIEPEVSPLLSMSGSNSLLVVSGSTTALGEGRRFMDFMMVSNSGTTTLVTTGTFIEAYVSQ